MVMVRKANPTNSPRSSDPGILAVKNIIAYNGYWFSVYTSLDQIPNPAGLSLQVGTLAEPLTGQSLILLGSLLLHDGRTSGYGGHAPFVVPSLS